MDALADTGATCSLFPEYFLNDIQIAPFEWTADVILADGTSSAKCIGPAHLQLLDREGPALHNE